MVQKSTDEFISHNILFIIFLCCETISHVLWNYIIIALVVMLMMPLGMTVSIRFDSFLKTVHLTK